MVKEILGSEPKRPLRIIFMGSPGFVVPVLEKLVESPLTEVVLVVTAPSETPIKKRAEELGLEIYTPTNLKQDGKIAKYKADLIIVSAYGKLIPKEILDLPKYGCLNIHPSLLPKYRGPSPGQAAILAGEKTSGVTIMLVDEGFDTGPILAQKEISLTDDETAESFYDKAFKEGVDLLLKVLPRYVAYRRRHSESDVTSDEESPSRFQGGPSSSDVRRSPQDDVGDTIFVPPRSQNHSEVTYSEKFTRDSGQIDWSKPDAEIERMIRAFYPWPGAWTMVGELVERIQNSECRSQNKERRVKVLKAHLGNDGRLVIDKLQIEGKGPISWEEFEAGYIKGSAD